MKILYYFIGLVYLVLLYIFKEWYIGWVIGEETLTEYISQYISIQVVYDISLALAIVFIITNIINSIFRKVGEKFSKKSLAKNITPMLNKILVVWIWVFWWIAVISNLWYDVKALLAWAGIGGLALALASQKTVANMFGAVNVLINRPFDLGDTIKVSWHQGVVEDIGFTYLKLRNTDGNLVMIPNETITSTIVENISQKK